MRYRILPFLLLLNPVLPAPAQVSVGIQLPHVSIGINLPVFPELVAVPGYPVYYAPRVDANYFFYDGMFWVFQGDGWYVSNWYNGPWEFVDPDRVPTFILRIPVRYYRIPPPYFRGWRRDAPPRWGEHWGHDWDEHHHGWDRWDRGSAPRAARPPYYQRNYAGDRYPHAEQQQELHNRYYPYQPREPFVRERSGRGPAEGMAPAPGRPGSGGPPRGNRGPKRPPYPPPQGE